MEPKTQTTDDLVDDASTRKLASAERIISLSPVEGADLIEVVTVKGWKCVVKKNEFTVGAIGVFIEVDSIVPETPVFEFMRPRKFRVRTIKLRGQLSQGLMLPFSQFTELTDISPNEGDNLTSLLGIKKFEPQVNFWKTTNARAGFPPHVNKTDEVRIQSEPNMLIELAGLPYVATIKLDGTSATYTLVDGELHACSRNLSVKDEEGSPYWEMARKYNLDVILQANPDLAIHGEICGPGIQGNRLNLPAKDLFVFDVYDKIQGRYFDYVELVSFASSAGIKLVPTEETNLSFTYTLEELLAKAEGVYDGTQQQREGLVFRPLHNLPSNLGANGRLSFKAISNRFLLGEVVHHLSLPSNPHYIPGVWDAPQSKTERN